MFAYQSKLGRRCPAYLREWLAGIVAAGDRRRLVGVVIWKPKGTRDREALVVVAESRDADVSSVRNEVSRRVRQAVGLPPEEVVLVTPGSLPKTSSGKLQRSLCRQRYLQSEL